MNVINNALSIKNVRMHGMSSAKWTTKDKITQYKGLVNLYKRDRNITQFDNAMASKRQFKEIVNIRKTIDTNRRELDNAVCGDRQQLRNILADHKELQMAFRNTDPKKVIEYVYQINFTKRKVLDKLRYHLTQKCQYLKDLKLEESVLQDRLKYEGYNQLKSEKTAQIITGKVQNALLKKEAALSIQQSYSQIIDVMRKDALYFDGILSSIQNDYWYQCRCVLNATKQGQLATEYKNDREQEFAALEKAIVHGLKSQKHDLKKLREQVQQLQSNLKFLLRRDSDLTTCVMEVEETEDSIQLHNDLEYINSVLTFLKSKTLVTSYELIYPRLEEQVMQKKRLTALAKKCETSRDIILNKLNHAETMSNVLENSMVETTGEYRRRKRELLDLMEAEKNKKKEFDVSLTYKHNTIARVRLAMRQLQQICKPVKTQEERNAKSSESLAGRSLSDIIVIPEEDEVDGLKIIDGLIPKISYLVSCAGEKADAPEIAYKYYEELMKDLCIEGENVIAGDVSLLEGIISEPSHLLTREDIRKQSDDIVASHSKED